MNIVILSIAIILLFFCLSDFKIIYSDNQKESEKIIGVNMKGMYTSLNYERFPSITIPSDYYDQSFKLIKNIGMNRIRYVLYWEAYENNPLLIFTRIGKCS